MIIELSKVIISHRSSIGLIIYAKISIFENILIMIFNHSEYFSSDTFHTPSIKSFSSYLIILINKKHNKLISVVLLWFILIT